MHDMLRHVQGTTYTHDSLPLNEEITATIEQEEAIAASDTSKKDNRMSGN